MKAAHHRILCLALATTMSLGFAAAARAELNCAISTAAGDPAPSTAKARETGRFRIFWQIATKIEDLADAAGNKQAMADIRQTQQRVDGYYFSALLRGPLVYWPDRPSFCDLNFKRAGETAQIDYLGDEYDFSDGSAGFRQCGGQQKKSFKGRSSEDVQVEALKRVVANLDLRGEQKRGKEIWGATIIRQQEFAYDRQSDRVTLKELPETYCAADTLGLQLNSQLVYQEPGTQLKTGAYLHIPMKNRRGEIIASDKPNRDSAPRNTRVYAMIGDAFARANVPSGGFRANIRLWNSRQSPRIAAAIAAEPVVRGFNFEGGARLLDDPKKSVDNYADGIAWILQNTSSDVSVLMPGYWPASEIGSLDEIDGLIPRVKTLMTSLSDKLNQRLGKSGGRNAICTSRITFVVASYGAPIHVKTLPSVRPDGKLAGTVAGQIKLLDGLRAGLCGG